jgi:polyphosphate kinase
MSARKSSDNKTKSKAGAVSVAPAAPDRAKSAGRKRHSDPLAEPEMYFNREWSWLDFNSRVLALAATPTIPLLERVKFLSITATNLDEFFMVRVAGLKEQVRAGTRRTGADGFSPVEQLEGISRRVREMAAQQSKLWLKELQPQLARAGIEVVTRNDLAEDELAPLQRYFVKQVLPVLTPMAVDPAHPFPHLPNKSLSLCVMLRGKDNGRAAKPLYAFVEIPNILPRFVPLKQSRERARFILLGEVIALHIDMLFPGSKVIETFTLRVTRDSDLEIDEEEAEDLLKVIEKELRQRQWGNVVRLEISNRAPAEAVKYLTEMLDIEPRDVVSVEGPVNYGDWMALARLPGYDHLRYPPFTPQVRPQWSAGLNVFDLIAAGDLLVHHPYESFASVAEFIESAATDPQVLAIKMTLYRTSPESPIMRSLVKAANNGKQVVALVELKARFDEANNIQWARLLEREGVHVVYGIVGLKTHCKASLVVRREGKQLRRYCHLGTGNYNPTTASIYTDLGLFTADPSLCEDVANLFNMLTGFANPAEWKRIVPAPKAMHARLLKLIRNEIQHARAGQKARIICKMNSLVEPAIIAALYEASRAGVSVDLIVRGICCLRPGVPGVSENIRVISIVGRFLEHSRIFYFSQGGNPLIYLSSADWMQRNFFSRVEVMFPVDDPDLRKRITDEILAASLNDNVNAWELRPDGTWKRRMPPSPGQAYDSHQRLIALEEKQASQPAVIKGMKT